MIKIKKKISIFQKLKKWNYTFSNEEKKEISKNINPESIYNIDVAQTYIKANIKF